MDATIIAALVLLGTTLGALGRTLLPYIQARKTAEETGEEPVGFQKKYVFTAIFAIITSVIVAFSLFDSLVKNVDTTNASATGIFIITFLAGYGTNSVVNGIASTRAGLKTKTK